MSFLDAYRGFEDLRHPVEIVIVVGDESLPSLFAARIASIWVTARQSIPGASRARLGIISGYHRGPVPLRVVGRIVEQGTSAGGV